MMGTDEASDVCGGVNRVNARRVPGQPPLRVRGLTVPPLLAGLVDSGRWRHPGDDVMRAALPWFEDPVVFLSSVRAMEWQSESLDFEADDEASSRLFRVARGSAAGPVRLPWLDTELSSSRSTGIQETTSRSRLTTAATQGSLQSSPVTSGLSRLPVSGGRSPPLSRRLPRCWASCRRNQRLSLAQVLRRLAGNCFRGPGHANDRPRRSSAGRSVVLLNHTTGHPRAGIPADRGVKLDLRRRHAETVLMDIDGMGREP